MMRKTILAVLTCGLMLVWSIGSAMELPSNAVFSPGLKKLAEMEKTQPVIEAEASVSIDRAMYARDLSVLQAMLDGLSIGYSSDGGEVLSIARGGETLGAYAVPESAALDALTERLTGTAVLERVPLADIAAWLEGLETGALLALGFSVAEPFVLERTMSDDGTRLTKVNLSGAIVREGEAPYRVEGFLRQPAGRAPKDTFELTFTQDEDNTIELLYSALRENEVTHKNKDGVASVRTTLKAAGQIAGSSISSRLTVTMKNRWTVGDGALSERVSITASLSHVDKTPGRRMQRLNDVAAEVKNVIRMTTHESGDETLSLSDEITFEVVLDSNTFLAGSADVKLRAGGEKTQVFPEAEQISETSAKALAQKIYMQLGEKAKENIQNGL